MHQAQVVVSYVQAGPLACSEDSVTHLHPLLAGQTAKAGGPAGTDPYATGSATALCRAGIRRRARSRASDGRGSGDRGLAAVRLTAAGWSDSRRSDAQSSTVTVVSPELSCASVVVLGGALPGRLVLRRGPVLGGGLVVRGGLVLRGAAGEVRRRTRPPRSPAPPAMSRPTSFISGSLEFLTSVA